MLHSTSRNLRYGALIGALGLLAAGAAVGNAEEPLRQDSAPPYVARNSSLTVAGAASRFSVDADHAEVLSVLKAVMAQAHQQFVPDHGVAGQVTLSVTSQPLTTVLSAICEPLFLRYQKDSRGIYRISQDEARIREAIAHIDTLNRLIREQLRGAGLNVPVGPSGDASKSMARNVMGGGFGGGAQVGGRGGAAPNANLSGSASPDGAYTNGVPINGQINNSLSANGQQGARNFKPMSEQAAAAQDAERLPSSNAPSKSAPGGATSQSGGSANALGVPQDRAAAAAKAAPLVYNDQISSKDAGAAMGRPAISPPPSAQLDTSFLSADDVWKILSGQPLAGKTQEESYRLYLKQNNLVAINTNHLELPVVDILHSLSAQSDVPILIDSSVPMGPKFRIRLSMPPRTLTEALNLLTPYLRLNWRTIGNAILVSATPDFEVFFGSSGQPRVIYGGQYGANAAQNGFGGPGAYPPGLGGGGTQNQRSDSGARSGQAPAANQAPPAGGVNNPSRPDSNSDQGQQGK